jgi:hypothetical protein
MSPILSASIVCKQKVVDTFEVTVKTVNLKPDCNSCLLVRRRAVSQTPGSFELGELLRRFCVRLCVFPQAELWMMFSDIAT